MRGQGEMNENDRGYPGWRVMWACAAAAFFASTPYQVFAVFLRPVSEEFSWSRESASGAYAVMALSAAAAAPLVGRLIDRIGARRVIVLSMIVVGLAVASLSLLTASLSHLYGVSVAIGVATIGASAVAHSRVIFGWFDVHRGRALGLMLAGGMVSAIVLPPAAVNLIRFFGWRAAWFALGMLIVVVGAPLVTRFLHERTAAPGAAGAVGPGATVSEAIRSRLFWTLMATIFGGSMMVSATIVHASALLTDRGFTPGLAAAVLSAMGAANLTGRLLTGWLLDRYPAPRVAAVLLTIGAVGGLLMAGADSIGVAMLAAILIGGGSGGEIDVNPYLLSRYFGLRSLATLYGLNWMALGTGSAIGPILMGRAHDATGSYAVILSQLAIVTLVTAGLMLTLPSPRAVRAAGLHAV
jgi:MFS family permease